VNTKTHNVSSSRTVFSNVITMDYRPKLFCDIRKTFTQISIGLAIGTASDKFHQRCCASTSDWL